MKSNIPTPLVVAVIAVVVIAAGLFMWHRANSATTDVANQVSQVNQGKPQGEAVAPSLATQGAAMRVKKGGQ